MPRTTPPEKGITRTSISRLGLDPNLIYTITDLLAWTRRKDQRRLAESLERHGAKVVRLCNGLTLVHGRDIERFFGKSDDGGQ